MSQKRLTAYVLSLIITALAATFSVNMYAARRARQAVLDEDRHVIQSAIHAYTVDKKKPPQSLNDLVDAGYLKALPKALTQDPSNLPTQ